jgi:PAS domain S-box-containing protein
MLNRLPRMGGVAHPLLEVDTWLVDSLVVPASLHDVEGRFVHLNAPAERAAGRSRAEMLGGHFTDPLPPKARRSVEAQFRRAAERGEPTDFETVFVDGSGQPRSVRAQHLPLRDGNAIVGVLILAYEVHALRTQPIVPGPSPGLTPRQREILELMALGLSTAAMAQELTLSTVTVRNHLQHVLSALHVHSRPEAIVAARRLGLLAVSPLGPSGRIVRTDQAH